MNVWCGDVVAPPLAPVIEQTIRVDNKRKNGG